MSQEPERELHRKDPYALIFIILGVLAILAICIADERMIPRY